MIKYLLYLILIFSVIKMYRNRLNSDEHIIYATLSILIGLIIINWLLSKTMKENFGNNNWWDKLKPKMNIKPIQPPKPSQPPKPTQ